MPHSNISRFPAADETQPLVAEFFAQLRGEGREPINLHRTLAHSPALLQALVNFAVALRYESATPRRLRELLILRVAQMESSSYVLAQHRAMALAAGVFETDMAALEHWRDSKLFDARERAALAFTESILRNERIDGAETDRHFTPAEFIELALTVTYYLMAARFIRACDIQIEKPASE